MRTIAHDVELSSYFQTAMGAYFLQSSAEFLKA